MMRSRWYLVPNADGLDKVASAITAFVDGQSPAEREAFDKASQEYPGRLRPSRRALGNHCLRVEGPKFERSDSSFVRRPKL